MSDGAVDRTTAPPPGRLRRFDFPDVVRVRFDNGLDLRVVRQPRVPVVTMRLVLPAGESGAPMDEAGIAVLTGDGLEGGTARRSGAEFAAMLERLGASLGVSTGWDHTSVAITCLADRKDRAADLLAEVALDPAFPEDEIDRVRSQQLAQLAQRREEPSALAFDQALRRIYRSSSPYARPLLGREESVAALDGARAAAFRALLYVPEGSGLVVVGHVDVEEIARLMEDRFSAWQGAGPRRPEVDGSPRTRDREIHVVHRSGAVQSEVRIGHPGVARSSPAYIPITVANMVLGGTFSSRLNLSLREEHGFTYGVASSFFFRRGAGPWMIQTGVGTDVTAAAVAEAVAVTERLVDEGVREDEVASARDYLAGVFPLQLETTSQIARRVGELVVYDLPEDWYVRYRDRVRDVTAENANAALRAHVHPDRAQIVVVGDADQIAGPLERLRLGPVAVHRLPA